MINMISLQTSRNVLRSFISASEKNSTKLIKIRKALYQLSGGKMEKKYDVEIRWGEIVKVLTERYPGKAYGSYMLMPKKRTKDSMMKSVVC